MARGDFLFFDALAKGERDSLFGLCGNVNCSAPSQILGTGMRHSGIPGNGNGLLEIQF